MLIVDPATRERLFEEAVLVYYTAKEEGRTIDRADFLRRFAEVAEELQAFLAGEDSMARAAAPVRDAIHQSPAPELPERIGEYKILGKICEGGMGVVYLAWDDTRKCEVALKMSLGRGPSTEEDLARFHFEASNVAQLDHPHIVPLYDFDEHEGKLFFTLKYIDGGRLQADSLWARFPEARAYFREVARLVAEVARAVHFAHQRGVMHRDLKPANILLDHDGKAYVTDFGLAKRVEGGGNLTRDGEIVGTPCYMAPEQASAAKALTWAVDVHGLGAVLYELLAGQPPFQGGDLVDILVRVRSEDPVRPSKVRRQVPGDTVRRQVPRDLEAICLKCLEKEPGKRYGSAHELAEDLERWLQGVPIKARKVGRVERLVKWARRRPAPAALVGLLVAVVVLGMPTLAFLWLRAEAAIKEKDRQHYATRIRVIGSYVADGHLDPAEEELLLCDEKFRSWEWHYLYRRCYREVRVLREHDREVEAARFSPDGLLIASTGPDGRLLLWERNTGWMPVQLNPSDQPFQPLSSVAFGGGGRWLACAGDENRLRIWDVATRREYPLAPVEGVPLDAVRVAATPNGKRLATVATVPPEGDRYPEWVVRVWEFDGRSLQLIRSCSGINLAVTSLAISPDGRHVAAGAMDNFYRVWDVDSGKVLPLPSAVGPGHMGGVFGVAFSQDSNFLAVDTAPIQLFDLRSRKQVNAFFGTNAMRCNDLAFVPGNTESENRRPDALQLAATFPDLRLRVWDQESSNPVLVRKHVELREGKPHEVPLLAVDFSRTGDYLVFSAGRDLVLCQLQPTHADLNRTLPIVVGAPCWATALSPDGKTVASQAGPHTLLLHDVETGSQRPLSTRGELGPGRELAFSPDGRWLASGSNDTNLELWDLSTRPPTTPVLLPASQTRCLAFSSDSRYVATSSGSGIDVWELATGVRLALPGSVNVETMAFHPKRFELAFGGSNGLIFVWPPGGTKHRESEHGHSGGITALAFDPGGEYIATTGPDLVLRTWNAENLASITTVKNLPCSTHRLAFTPDGRRVVAGRGDGRISVWDPESGVELLSLPAHTRGGVSDLSFDRNGTLATSGKDGTVRLWDGRPLSPTHSATR